MTDTAIRYNANKPRMDLLPWDALLELASHYGNCTAKYPDRNWEKGLDWNKGCAASLARHLAKWSKEDYEVETLEDGTVLTTYHDVAMVWNAIALVAYRLRKVGVDDRPKPGAPQPSLNSSLTANPAFTHSIITTHGGTWIGPRSPEDGSGSPS